MVYLSKDIHSKWFYGILQNAIAIHESNGIDIIIALVLNDINPLGEHRMDLVLELKVRGSLYSIQMVEEYLLKDVYVCDLN